LGYWPGYYGYGYPYSYGYNPYYYGGYGDPYDYPGYGYYPNSYVYAAPAVGAGVVIGVGGWRHFGR
jgi:hypothetical protein